MDDEFNAAVEDFQNTMAEVARLQAECAQLTATATAQRRRVRVTVNADGIAVEIKFSAGIGDLTFEEIADAVTEASRSAVLEVARKKNELMEPIAVDPSEVPKLDDLFAAVSSLRDSLG
jgi:DNA-binding protein YbaB